MKKLILLSTLLLISSSLELYGQSPSVPAALTNKFVEVSQEDIYVHYNSSLFFPGEYLFYKVYCMNTRINKLSKISSVSYVELVNSNKEVVFRHKVELDDGIGQGDYFIPTEISSGNYKLIAYTNWMRNKEVDVFFQADIGIINPYHKDQTAILASHDVKSGPIFTAETNFVSEENRDHPIGIDLTLERVNFKKRQAVSVRIKNKLGFNGYGNYSLSVNKISEISSEARKTARQFSQENENNKKGSIKYLPELNGELIVGRVLRKEDNRPAAAQNVAISIPGEDFYFRIKATDDYGYFTFPIEKSYDVDYAVIQIASEDREAYIIEMAKREPIQYPKLEFSSLRVSPAMERSIVNRSIYNQIENGYYGVKPDTIRPISKKVPFAYYEDKTTYTLEEFTRLPTVKDVFKELIKHVWTRNDKNGNRVFQVRQHEYDKETDDVPLVFVDEVFIQDHERILDMNPNRIVSISVTRDRYKYGEKEYLGVILINTEKGSGIETPVSDFIKQYALFNAVPVKEYFHQNYSVETNHSRIPDFRNQLLWEPSIILEKDEMEFQFYTSDNLGTYEVVLEGFTIEGSPVSLRKIIQVEE